MYLYPVVLNTTHLVTCMLFVMEELLESTTAVSRGLETLQSEHAALLEELGAVEHHGMRMCEKLRLAQL